MSSPAPCKCGAAVSFAVYGHRVQPHPDLPPVPDLWIQFCTRCSAHSGWSVLPDDDSDLDLSSVEPEGSA